ncbi:argininosuccinate lyase [Temperatibacter marinus]|uniref:Argininosuccinate lyase n=1 Tax=Temperatibacter marinus TaxID=1456591 RepID=A0AA52EJL7_9PROT|nr:argininosuccinate lyase [Temperatibacter marinus]WND04000.1 argininosuccinate lyase [Temperatibacter marinus]
MSENKNSVAQEESKASSEDKQSNSMWGGRFKDGPSAIMQAINASIDFDKRLYAQDIRGSLAHAAMLESVGIISAEDLAAIQQGLAEIKQEIEEERFEFSAELEDIHMNIEARLKSKIGDAGARLHTARSRNDQVATDFKLWCRDSIDRMIVDVASLQSALVDQAENYADAVMPGFTHLQTAQPVTLGHHLMAYFEMLERDKGRLKDCRIRLNENPLGSAALAGTPFPIDREQTSSALGFDRPTRNSLDAVSDRDFALELLSVLSLSAVHLSRLADEIVLWASAQFKFIELSDRFSTGSSIMPQKRNPDAAELVRSKVGRITGQHTTLTLVMKGLPLAYSKDMQEDKVPVFTAVEDYELCIAAMTGMIRDLKANKGEMAKAAALGFSTATDLADWCVRELNMPFRNAHHVTGAIVALAEKQNKELKDLSLEEMQSVEPEIHTGIFDVLSIEASVGSRQAFGGTSPQNVKAAVAYARNHLL